MIKVSQNPSDELNTYLSQFPELSQLGVDNNYFDEEEVDRLLKLLNNNVQGSVVDNVDDTFIAPSDTTITQEQSKSLINDRGFQPPIRGDWKVSGAFSLTQSDERHPKGHLGVDLRAPAGTPIYPIAPGIVTSIGDNPVGGYVVNVDHANGIKTYYAHCSTINVRKGDQVGYDTQIATVGDTGNAKGTYPHLHFQVSRNGQTENPGNYFTVPAYTPLGKNEKRYLSDDAKRIIEQFNLKKHLASKTSSNTINSIYKLSCLYYELSK